MMAEGISRGDKVGICLNRSINMLAAVIGTLKAGACYVPMDPLYPTERLQYMLQDASVDLLITQKSLTEKHRGLDVGMLHVDAFESLNPIDIGNQQVSSVDADTLAYIIYTSGSTGKPKGVKVQHSAVVNFIQSMLKVPGILATDTLLAITTLSFDISVLELFLPLCKGATVYIASGEEASNGALLANIIEKEDITYLQATPSTWNMLFKAGWKGKNNLVALCGGEAMTNALAQLLCPVTKSLWNMYGPTETTVWSACAQITNAASRIVVGKPIDNTHIIIVDNQNQAVPAGVYGEVVIGGSGVTKGYVNNVALTQEKFVVLNNMLVYKTGDKGCINPDGDLEIAGRIDLQVKLRGFRIEPGEIENRLCLIPGIAEAVAKVHAFGDSDQRLVAFIGTNEAFNLSEKTIREALGKHLPPYMLPAHYQVVKEFPRSAAGKIDRNKLVFNIGAPGNHSTMNQHANHIEQALLNIWAGELKHNSISLDDSFFNLGGHSLLAISVINKIEDAFDVALSPSVFYKGPTIRHLAEVIAKQGKGSKNKLALPRPTGNKEKLPLSENQKGIWLLYKLHGPSPSYNLAVTYKLHGKVTPRAMEETMQAIFKRRFAINSRFYETDHVPYCKIVANNKPVVTPVDLPARGKNIDGFLKDEMRQSFNLTSGEPLYRVFLVKAGEENYYFHATIHHIVFDGWSTGLLVKDINHVYDAVLAGKPSAQANDEYTQYDFATIEQEMLLGSSKKFWQHYLNGCPALLDFPYQATNKVVDHGYGENLPFEVDRELTLALNKISRELNVSLYSALLSCFGLLVQKYTGQEDFCIGTPVANRPFTQLEDVYGMMVNTIVYRHTYQEGETIGQLMLKAHNNIIASLEHSNFPFEKIVEAVNPRREQGVNPLFQVCFAWQNHLNVPMQTSAFTGEWYLPPNGVAPFNLTFYLWEANHKITGYIEYNPALISREMAHGLKNCFINLVHHVCKSPDDKLEQIGLLGNTELQHIESFNLTATNCPKMPT
ncbi:MAG: amino acid adenylation domain-containing protein [Bacteroidales bacterium]|nr:amino acid adenylation domain-containing protein [Bacteroidales bacterium]